MSSSSPDRAGGEVLGVGVRRVAEALVALFERDQRLAVELNAAQQRLLDANARLTVGLSAGALRTLLGPARPNLGLSGRRPPVLEAGSPVAALSEVADGIRHAFVNYQHAAEERRQLAADVGELTVRLVDAMKVAGFSEAQARWADVWALRDGAYRPATGRAER